MKIQTNSSKVNKKNKSQSYFPSQFVAMPLWILEDFIFRNRSSVLQSFINFVARYTLGMRGECCFYSVRRLAKLMKHSKSAIQKAIKEAKTLGYISEGMMSVPGKICLEDKTKGYRINLLPPEKWKSPMPQNTFFEAYNLTREIEDIKLKLSEKVHEDNPDIEYIIEKTRNYLTGRIPRKDFEDVLSMFDK